MKTHLISCRNFSIELPTKKHLNEFMKIADSYIEENFPEQSKCAFDTIEEMIYATSVKEAVYIKLAELNNFKVNK